MCKHLYVIKFAWVLVALICTSCEKAIIEDHEPVKVETGSTATMSKGNVIICIDQLDLAPFLTTTNCGEINPPTHLCFAIYDMGGTRLKQLNQKLGDQDYGKVGLQLNEGTYQLVLLAHSSTKNPTMTNLSKVQFNNSIGYTDTYLYHTTLTVTDEPQTLDLTLDRIVALCRFVISDPIPDDVTQFKFQYKGGSGHFSALTGLGVTNSTQVVTRQVQPGPQYQVFDLYTFLHQEEGSVELTATAITATGEEYCAWEFQIPMKKNQITWLTGNFFAEESDPGQWRVTPNIALDKTWANEVFYTY